jgi:Predicted O-methyltransferase
MSIIGFDRIIDIPGATRLNELEWLNEHARGKKCIVELGTYLGRSTIALASGGKVYAVDDFIGDRSEIISDEDRAKIYERFLHNIKGFPNIYPVICDHADYDPPDEVDMVFIDGSHKYNDVIRDILKYKHRDNILICGHDYLWWPSVKEAVDKMFGFDGYKVYDDNLWYVEQK